MKWTDELDQLDRVFKGGPTVEEAERNLAQVSATYDGLVEEAERALFQAEKSLDVEDLEHVQRTWIGQKIDKLKDALAALKDRRRVDVAQAKGILDSRKVWEPRRADWLALSARKKKVDAALALRV